MPECLQTGEPVPAGHQGLDPLFTRSLIKLKERPHHIETAIAPKEGGLVDRLGARPPLLQRCSADCRGRQLLSVRRDAAPGAGMSAVLALHDGTGPHDSPAASTTRAPPAALSGSEQHGGSAAQKPPRG